MTTIEVPQPKAPGIAAQFQKFLRSKSDFQKLHLYNEAGASNQESAKDLNENLKRNLGGWYSLARFFYYKK